MDAALAVDADGVLRAIAEPRRSEPSRGASVGAGFGFKFMTRAVGGNGHRAHRGAHRVANAATFLASLHAETMAIECAPTSESFYYFLDLDTPRASWSERRIPSQDEVHALVALAQSTLRAAVGDSVGAVVVASAVPLGAKAGTYELLHADDGTKAGAHAYWRLRVSRAAAQELTARVRAAVALSLGGAEKNGVIFRALGLDSDTQIETRADAEMISRRVVDDPFAYLTTKGDAQLRVVGTPKVLMTARYVRHGGNGVIGQPYRVVMVVNADGSRNGAREAALASGAESAVRATLITPCA